MSSDTVSKPLPTVIENGDEKMKKSKEVVLGRNIQRSCFEVKEPEAIDELTGHHDTCMADVIARYTKRLTERADKQLGYPINQDNDYGALEEFQQFAINNNGNPFIEINYGLHSRQFEIGVLDWFAKLWEIQKDKYWGYVTSCGSEGNFYGILVGREVLPDGILYVSEESHYSILKAARMYRIECVKIDTLASGKIDCSDLKVELLKNKHRPAIVNVNIGTTLKGAIDDLDLVIQTIEECGFSHDKYYIHCDGALSGLMLPFIEHAPKLSFKKPIGSICVSGHKFIGSPVPCGVVITNMDYINFISTKVDYDAPTTLFESRNGHTPMFLWYALNKKGYIGLQNQVLSCLKNAQYLKDGLSKAGISAMLNEFSNTVVFERPHDEEFVRKRHLACSGNIAHVVVMPHVSAEKLDSFLTELIEQRSVWYGDGQNQHRCVAEEIGSDKCACSQHKRYKPQGFIK